MNGKLMHKVSHFNKLNELRENEEGEKSLPHWKMRDGLYSINENE